MIIKDPDVSSFESNQFFRYKFVATNLINPLFARKVSDEFEIVVSEEEETS